MTWRSPGLALCLIFVAAAGLLSLNAAAAPLPEMPLSQPTPTPIAATQGGGGIQVEAALQVDLAADSHSGYLIVFRAQPDLSPAYDMDWEARGEFVVQALQATAEASQAAVRAYLDAQGVPYEAFWIDNVIAVEQSDVETLNGLMSFGEISALKARRTAQLIEPQVNPDTARIQAVGVEPNIAHVGADQAWAQGIDGSGIVVAGIDTGVRYTHQALVSQYRGNLGDGTFDHDYNWFSAINDFTAPADTYGHGTHTMGTMVGDDGGDNQIGMAPGARWIACEGCSAKWGCPDSTLLACGQWVLAPYPDGDQAAADPDLRPDVVNNSWGDCGRSYDGWYRSVVNAWVAAGIYPVFSAGNAPNCNYSSPPTCGTVGNPARYPNVTAVGSTGTSDGLYATHSNWGPGDLADMLNPLGYPLLKPQVVAPGVNIRSSVQSSDTSYQAGWSGTSMSAPHVSGLVALLWQAAPDLRGDYVATETIIEQSATPITYTTGCASDGTGGYPNCATGWGEIDTMAALAAAREFCGHGDVAGHVTAADGGAALADVQVSAVGGESYTFAMKSSDAGAYDLSLPPGEYTVTFAAEGYVPVVHHGVTISSDNTVTLDAALIIFVPVTLSGVVTDAETGWPLYARVAMADLGTDPAWSDPVTGEYQVQAAAGVTLTVTATAWVEGYLTAEQPVAPLTDDGTCDLALTADPAACTAPGRETGDGCSCNAGGLLVGQVRDENTALPLAGATVEGEATAAVTAAATPDDPAVGDAFYTLFLPAGTNVVTATLASGYAPASDSVAMADGETQEQDWALPAGRLAVSPGQVETELLAAQSVAVPLTLTNSGGITMTYTTDSAAVAPTSWPATWLALASGGGGLAPGESAGITVTLDAGDTTVTRLGDYTAVITLENDTPYGPAVVPVTLTVLPRPVSYLPLVGRYAAFD